MKIHLYDQATRDRIYSLNQGFYLNKSGADLVLTIKLDTALLSSLVKGCPFHLEVEKTSSNIYLIIEDNKQQPFYVIGNSFSPKHSEHISFESIYIDLIKTESIKLVYFNDINYQIFCHDIAKRNDYSEFLLWLRDSNCEVFTIKIDNKDFSEDIDRIFIDPLLSSTWDKNLINDKEVFNFKDYLSDGKHGYVQEFSIRTMLSAFFVPQEELFYSVKKADGEELIDLIVYFEKALLLFESKLTISKKHTKFNDAVVKAATQLQKAEETVMSNYEVISEPLRTKIENLEVILKICLFNDDGRNLEQAFRNIATKSETGQLPIYISVIVFKQLLGFLKIQNSEYFKYNLIQNLLDVRSNFSEKKIIVIGGLDIATGALQLL